MTLNPSYQFTDLEHDFHLNPNDLTKMEILLNQLLEMNQTTNLTAITCYEEALVKHIYDSLLILKWPEFNNSHKIIDIGSGAGFPALPLSICNSNKQFVMIEATQKKVNFQLQASEILNLNNVKPVWGRSETFAHQDQYRQQFDLVIARAVAASATLAEITIPFAALGGYIVFYKGQDYQDELKSAKYAIENLGGQFLSVIQAQLPLSYGERNLIILKKIKNTPAKYPRQPGIPQKRPLVSP